jgi:hypothetical protein
MNERSATHDETLLREAAHRLADTVAPYRVLTGARLAQLAGAPRWTTIDFQAALRWAVDHRFLLRLDDELYEIGPEANSDETAHLVVEGGW